MKTRIAIGLASVATALLILGGGCEDVASDSSLTVTPNNATLTGVQSVALTASHPDGTTTLLTPLVWSVNNDTLGSIIRTAGASAVYQSNGNVGQNVVTVRDPAGREGLAVINQVTAP